MLFNISNYFLTPAPSHVLDVWWAIIVVVLWCPQSDNRSVYDNWIMVCRNDAGAGQRWVPGCQHAVLRGEGRGSAPRHQQGQQQQ